MNLEDLRAAQTRERATDGLQELRDSFYLDVAEYIAELKAQRETAAAAADDPFGDPEVQELTDKIETAEQVAEAIYERRMGKLVKQASLAAAGMPDDANGLTDEERVLYDDLVDRIESNKSHVLDVISGEADAGSAESHPDAPGRDADASAVGDESPADLARDADGDAGDASAAAAMGGGLEADGPEREADDPDAARAATDGSPSADADSATDSGVVEADPEPPDAIAEDLAELHGDDSDDAEPDSASESGGDDVERTTVRMIDDVGEIFGMDEREYTLEAEDVVTLPEENAKPLVEKDAAEKLD